MGQTYVQVPTDGAGKKIATEEQVVGPNTLEFQQVVMVPGKLPAGCSVYHLVAANGTNEHNVKPSPGQVYGYRAYNSAGYQLFVKLHNTAGTPAPGSGVVQTIGLEAGLPDKDFNPLGAAFDTGIGISIVKGIADSDATTVSANDCVVDLFYA